ncbi:MAG: AAA family ATPase [Nitrososphaerota archaeon]|nr:AAA family ATPase [Candidatus Calditenuaceae archaeon]MDW8073871.1 AAA family ATPase [Nitrososphaerota archaeon]
MPSAYLVAGTPGVGKSTVASGLAARLDAMLIELRDLADAGEVEVHPAKLSARAGARIKRAERDAVIASHIVFRPRGVPLIGVVVLRRSPLRLLAELGLRGYSEEKMLENVEAELLGVVYVEALQKVGKNRVFQVDTTDRDVEETMELAYKALKGGWAGEEVDWVSRLEKEGRLRELLDRLSAKRV